MNTLYDEEKDFLFLRGVQGKQTVDAIGVGTDEHEYAFRRVICTFFSLKNNLEKIKFS